MSNEEVQINVQKLKYYPISRKEICLEIVILTRTEQGIGWEKWVEIKIKH